MTVNIEVNKKQNENNMSVIRRFTKRVQGSGILRRVRGIRYSERLLSPYKIKKKKLKQLRRHAEVQWLIKIGRMTETPTRGRK